MFAKKNPALAGFFMTSKNNINYSTVTDFAKFLG